MQSGPVPVETLELLLRPRFGLHAPEEVDGDVPVPNLSDQLGEASDPTVDGAQLRSVRLLQELLPDREPGP